MSIALPGVIAGTSLLGNLYEAYSFDQKTQIVRAYIETCAGIPVFDSAGKYGAGLALQTLGRCLHELGVPGDRVMVSNKLGWLRVPLTGSEPTFEPGVWKNLQHDAMQDISYEGILRCFEQGNELLTRYTPQLISVHDPDEYLAAACDKKDEQKRYQDILEAYRALHQLKSEGRVMAVGIGAKAWKVTERIYNDVPLDYVMLANSLTIYHHPPDLLRFVERLNNDGVTIINSAVFHGGFLTGSNYFDYQAISDSNPQHVRARHWRSRFFALCEKFEITPAAACVYFATHIPGIKSIALNSSSPERTRQNNHLAGADVPQSFWSEMKFHGLIAEDYRYL